MKRSVTHSRLVAVMSVGDKRKKLEEPPPGAITNITQTGN